jgi:hypothetical protein
VLFVLCMQYARDMVTLQNIEARYGKKTNFQVAADYHLCIFLISAHFL